MVPVNRAGIHRRGHQISPYEEVPIIHEAFVGVTAASVGSKAVHFGECS